MSERIVNSSLVSMSELRARAESVRGLILDVDGVMTDGRLLYGESGEEFRSFHVRDALGLQLWSAAGGRIGVISGRQSRAVARRVEELGVHQFLQGVGDKVSGFEGCVEKLGLSEDAVAYVGDDLPDLPLLGRAQIGFAVADAAPELRSAADFVLRSAGGWGAVREVCEWLLKAQNRWTL